MVGKESGDEKTGLSPRDDSRKVATALISETPIQRLSLKSPCGGGDVWMFTRRRRRVGEKRLGMNYSDLGEATTVEGHEKTPLRADIGDVDRGLGKRGSASPCRRRGRRRVR